MTRGESSRVYIVLIGSEEKVGALYPHVLGFESDGARNVWLSEGGKKALERWQQNEVESWGGWPTYVEIGPGLEESPAAWLHTEEAFFHEEFEEKEGE